MSKLPTSLGLDLNHLCEHRFEQRFWNYLDQLCSYENGGFIINCFHLMHCSNYWNELLVLLSSIRNNNTFNFSNLIRILLFGKTSMIK